MSSPLNHLYQFGNFRLDGRTGTLWSGSEVVSLSPKSVEVLKLLVAREGQVVSKQEIFDSVWADTFVEDGVLTQNIYTLRHKLGRDVDGKQYIETVPRRGYRFAGAVTVIPAADEVAAEYGSARTRVFEDDDDALSADYLEEFDPGPRVRTIVDSPVTHRRWSKRLSFAVVCGILLLAAAAFAVYRYMPRDEIRDQQSNIAPIEQVRFQSLTDTGDVIYPTVSPDGEMLASVRLEGEQASVWVMQVATGSSIQALPPSRKGYSSLAFSTDGRYLFFREERDPGSVYQTTPLGGTPKKIADNVWSDFSISPDNTRLAFVRRDPTRNSVLLVLANVNDGAERILGTRQPNSGYRRIAPAWSPDGGKLAVAVSSATEARPVLIEVDVASGSELEIKTPHFREVTRLLWRPNSRNLLVAARLAREATSQIWTLSIPDGEHRRLTNDLEAYFWLSISADGRTLVARQQRITSHLWLLPGGDMAKARQLTFGARGLDGYVGLTWTPDRRIIFSSRSGSVTDLYSLDPESDERIQLTSNTGVDNTWPAVSPDGSQIFFVSSRSGARAVWRMDREGGNHRLMTQGDFPLESMYAPALSPDGSEVFYLKTGDGHSSIWKASINGENATQVSRLTGASAEGFLAVSPDGKWLAYQHVSETLKDQNEDRGIQVGVIAADGSGDPTIFDIAVRRPIVRWTANDRFDYASGSFNSSSLWQQSLDGSSTKLLEFPDRVFNFAWSTDGKDLVVARGRLLGDAVLITNLP